MIQTKRLAKKIAYYLDFHKGENVEIIDVEDLTPITRFVILVTASSSRQLNSFKEIALKIAEHYQVPVKNVEDKYNTPWVIVDLNDIVIHIMDNNSRTKYNLEGVYAKGKKVEYSDYKPTKKENF